MATKICISSIQDFVTTVKQDKLAKTLLHLAICITNTVLEESAMELLAPGNKQEETEETQQTQSKQPPRKSRFCLTLGKNFSR